MAKRGCQCLRILLAVLCCQSACPPFQSQDHRLCLVWFVFFPVTTGICRQLLALPGLDELSSLFRDTGLWQCAVDFRLLAPSLAMILSRTSFRNPLAQGVSAQTRGKSR